jgi:hypothetical protein
MSYLYRDLLPHDEDFVKQYARALELRNDFWAEEMVECVSARGFDADRRRGHRSQTNKAKTLDSRVRPSRGQNSISIYRQRRRPANFMR